MDRCAICGCNLILSFQCSCCGKRFCQDHRGQEEHNCSQTAAVSEQASKLEVLYPSDGLIYLNREKISPAIQNLIQSYRDEELTMQLKVWQIGQLIKKDPRGPNLVKMMQPLINHHLIEGILGWLKSYGGLTRVSRECNIPLKMLAFENLLDLYYCSLRDASFNKQIITEEIDSFQRRSQRKAPAKVYGSVIASIKALTDLSEHARQSGEREVSGYLIGKRHKNKSLIEITRFQPTFLGDIGVTTLSPETLVETMNSIENTNEIIVGFAHSHPYTGLPWYSHGDKIAHLKISITLSVFDFLSGLDSPLSFNYLVNLALNLSQYNFTQLEFILESIVAMLHVPHVLGRVLNALSLNNPDSWAFLESQINDILQETQIKTNRVNFKMLPQVGIVICPWRREVGMIDCSFNKSLHECSNPVKEWFYYRISLH